ncbi:MAG: protein-glutamate O-methyltransferase CheR [Deltaproteobacteria bacterium]|nr:protein-glutamate O-methyltransferase CheR [Deltaproteobacteria bacterium]
MTKTRITRQEFAEWSQYIQRICGVHLEAGKTYLIESRLTGLLKDHYCTSFGDLYEKALKDRTRTLEKQVIDRITTNETLFFRDESPFELLKYKILPDLLDRKMENAPPGSVIPIRIWSCGCAMGQEVYSIAIAIKELLGDLEPYHINILGTDISNDAVARASRGEYNRLEIERGLSRERLERYFSRNGDKWKINDDIRSLASFKKINIMDPFSGLSVFDIIFCRNVAIYFTREDRRKLFERISKVMDPLGYLIIGATETLTDLTPRFEPKRYLRAVFYQLRQN